MTTRLALLCASATASSRSSAFPAPDEPIDEGGWRKAEAVRLRGPVADIVVTSPSRAAIETAEAIGLTGTIESCLADLHFGRWAGRRLADVAASEAPALRAWLADPAGAAPGGESMTELADRVGAWMDRQAGTARSLIVVSHAAVMRAAIGHALSIPVASALSIDIAPLTLLRLSFVDRWRLRELRAVADGLEVGH